MGERLLCKQEVIGSIPFTSTRRGGIQGTGLEGKAFQGCSVGPKGRQRSLTIGLCKSREGDFRRVAWAVHLKAGCRVK